MKKLLNAGFAALLIAAPAMAGDTSSPQMAQARAGTGETVVDSRGTLVGTLIGSNTGERFVDSQFVPAVMPQGFFGTSSIQLYFTSTDCSGPAYMDAGALPVRAFIIGSGKPDHNNFFNSATLYFPAPPFGWVPTRSDKNTNNPCETLPYPQDIFAGPVKTFALPVFVPPFTVR